MCSLSCGCWEKVWWVVGMCGVFQLVWGKYRDKVDRESTLKGVFLKRNPDFKPHYTHKWENEA